MEQRLTSEQLNAIVAEVQELEQSRQQELTTAAVRDILQELNLPAELLEDAQMQIQRRQAIAAQQRRQRWLWGGILGVTIALGLGFATIAFQQQQQLNRVTARADRLTLAVDDGGSRTEIDRQTNNQVFYRITLANAPVGQSLALSCNWIGPSGEIVHQNRFQTKTIATPVWQSHCRYSIGANTPPGTWQVKAFLGDRILSSAQFTIR
jgi:hypothetical protein